MPLQVTSIEPLRNTLNRPTMLGEDALYKFLDTVLAHINSGRVADYESFKSIIAYINRLGTLIGVDARPAPTGSEALPGGIIGEGTTVRSIADLDPAGLGFIVKVAAAAVALRILSAGTAISISNADGSAGNPVINVILGSGGAQAWDADLDALAALASTAFVVRTAAATYALRTITGTANQIDVANGSGVSGNPTLSLAALLALQGIRGGVTSQSGNYTVADEILGVFGTGGAGGITVTLPAASVSGRLVYVVKVDGGAGAVTVSRAGADAIEGGTTVALAAQWDSVLLISDGTATWTRMD